jgi:hypothetical protein
MGVSVDHIEGTGSLVLALIEHVYVCFLTRLTYLASNAKKFHDSG